MGDAALDFLSQRHAEVLRTELPFLISGHEWIMQNAVIADYRVPCGRALSSAAVKPFVESARLRPLLRGHGTAVTDALSGTESGTSLEGGFLAHSADDEDQDGVLAFRDGSRPDPLASETMARSGLEALG